MTFREKWEQEHPEIPFDIEWDGDRYECPYDEYGDVEGIICLFDERCPYHNGTEVPDSQCSICGSGSCWDHEVPDVLKSEEKKPMSYKERLLNSPICPKIPGNGLEGTWCPSDWFDHFKGHKACDGCTDYFMNHCVECWAQEYQGEPEINMYGCEASNDVYKAEVSDEVLKSVKGGPDSLKADDCNKIKVNEGLLQFLKDCKEEAMNENPPKIQDSGHRREFETGAVRDICEGKGRCDLLPLGIVGCSFTSPVIDVFHKLDNFQHDGTVGPLYDILRFYYNELGFKSTADMMLEVAIHFEDGCKKYGENNWRKGIPAHCYIDSAVRHYLKFLRGDTDERHDRAFVWNVLCCIWTCVNKPELNDYARKDDCDENH